MPTVSQTAIELIGFMGAGKSTVGRRVAQILRREFVDTDELLEQSTGMSVAELFRCRGERAFRAREGRAVEASLAVPGRVVAVGGGAVLSMANRTVMKKSGLLIYLRATPETLAARLRNVTDRPLLKDGADRATRIRDLLVARGPIYETACDIAVDTDRRTVEQTADFVIGSFRTAVSQARPR